MAGCAVKPGEKQRKYRFLEVKCLLSMDNRHIINL